MSDEKKPEIDEGGPAFPTAYPIPKVEVLYDGKLIEPESPPCMIVPGMSLRDYFAGQALTALAPPASHVVQYPNSELATWSYQIADAMIEERKKGPGR